MSNEQEKFNCAYQEVRLRQQDVLQPPSLDAPALLPTGGRGRYRVVPGAAVCQGGRCDQFGGMTTKNTAQNVIFILLAGAPSHTDTFDLKVVPGTTPASFAPETVNGVLWPTGLLPKLGTDDRPVRHRPLHAGRTPWCTRWRRPGRRSDATRRRRWATSRPISAAWWPSRRTRAQARAGFPDLPGAEFAGRRDAGLFPRDLCAVQGDSALPAASPTPPIPTARRASTTAGR